MRPSEIHRWGVYALEFIPKRHKVIEYTGERCNRRETSKRAGAKLNYMFTLDNYWAIDGSAGGSGAEYLNHSCEPNCYAWVFRGHILYMSARDIQPGEELTIDYHFAADVDKVPCACGAGTCRGTINLHSEPRKRKPAVSSGGKNTAAKRPKPASKMPVRHA